MMKRILSFFALVSVVVILMFIAGCGTRRHASKDSPDESTYDSHDIPARALNEVKSASTPPRQPVRDLPGDGIYNPYNVPVDSLYEIKSASTPHAGEAEQGDAYQIPADNIYLYTRQREKEPEVAERGPAPKISPVLRERIATMDSEERVEIIVTFTEDLRIPLLPELEPGVRRGEGKTRREEAIEKIIEKRVQSQERLLTQLSGYGSFEPKKGLWIVNSVVIETSVGEIEGLAEFQEAVYLQPVKGDEQPPMDGNNNNDAEDSRAAIVSDPYFNLGLINPWIGLLDTGVLETHTMFNSPDRISWMRDCVNGGPNCNGTSNPNFDAGDHYFNHGTSSAGILTGNKNLGSAFRGVTAVLIDSWKVYTAAGVDSEVAGVAIGAALSAYDEVLVCEIVVNETEVGEIATAADNAYDAGAIVLAANGNFGAVRSPAIAHKVLGVGAFTTDGGAQYSSQSLGPATDGRYKPDIQAPSWSETSSNANDTALQVFSKTSCATAVASGAAMLARNWLRKFGTKDNGQTYAFMILYGQNEWPYDNTVGAGPIIMATDGWAWWGKVAVIHHMNIDIPIKVGAGRHDLDVALWWPESAYQKHNDIDVHLIDPSGVERAKGYSCLSVFERTGVGGDLQPGIWTIRIRGYSVKTLAQTVYWAAHVRN